MTRASLFKPLNYTEINDDTYTAKITVPQYQPTGDCPFVYSLCDKRKYEQLCQEIDKSNVSDADKEFLRLAATRHIVFDYAKIAEYYCHASAEMQKLMENSALVLIDVDDAIRNGYVILDEQITKLAKDAWEERLRTKGK
jgi:hypothetical protein